MHILLDVPVLSPSTFPLPVDRPFTTSRANAAGLSPYNLRKLCEHGLLRRMLKGVYVAAQVEDGLLVRAQALALVVPENAAVTDWTALWLWTGLLPPGGHLEIPPVQVFRYAGHGRLRNGLCESGERTFRAEDLTAVEGLTVTVPLRTAWDLGRLAHRDVAIGALDALLRLASFDSDQLLAGGDVFKKQRGVRQLRELAPLADPRSESFGESTLRLRWHDCSDLPQPKPQIPVSGRYGVTWWLDLGVAEIRFASEYDGEAYHSTDEQIEHDRQRRQYLDDIEGWVIKPVRKENVFGRHRNVEAILYEGVAEARRRLGGFRSR